MKLAIAPTLALGVILAASTACAAEDAARQLHRHHPGHRPAPAVQHSAPVSGLRAPAVEEPAFRPFRPGEGDTDGLSRDPDDCNMGCIGGNPG